MTRFIHRAAAMIFGLLAVAGLAHASQVNQAHGIAIAGYDPVAYFTDGKPVKGLPTHRFIHDGVTYEFASEAHRRLFAAAPGKYTPRFDGFCAFGVAHGRKADIDPTAFTIVDGALYLNHSIAVREAWKQDIPGNIDKANDAWPAFSQQTDVIH